MSSNTIIIHMKSPESIRSALKDKYPRAFERPSIYHDDADRMEIEEQEIGYEADKEVLDTIFQYGECLSIEVDLDKGTAHVLVH